MERSPILAIISDESELESVNAIVRALGYQRAEIVEGTAQEAAEQLYEQRYNPKYILLYIANRGVDVLNEIDSLAEQCVADTRVVVIGQTNDIRFYRELKNRGIVEYFNYPVPTEDVRHALFSTGNDTGNDGTVISVFAGGSGDGSSMVALNTAYLIAKEHGKKTVLVDLDYQFGMVARQLELSSNYGIKEIFDHPERGVDKTLIDRMAVPYKDGLDIITSPVALHYMPTVQPDLIRNFITHLSARYDFVILDLPHLWNHWISATIAASDRIIMVGQLLLKSITHGSRILSIWDDLGFDGKPTSIVINRSGSRYKEAVHPKDFERICGRPIDHYIPNDIKTICTSENRGVPVADIGKSQIATELGHIARSVVESDEVM